MKFRHLQQAFILLSIALTLSIHTASAQNLTKEELIRRAMEEGYNEELRQGLDGLNLDEALGDQLKDKSGSKNLPSKSKTTDRTRKDSDPDNLEYNRRNAAINKDKRSGQESQYSYTKRTTRDKNGNLIDAESGDIFERADGTITPLGRKNLTYDDDKTSMDPWGMEPKELTPEEKEKLRQAEKKIQDSILVNSVFGREIFSAHNLTFAPNYNLPTPANYVLGASDRLFIDLWGEAEANHDLQVSPDGMIVIPDVGVIAIGGLTIGEAERRIKSKMQQSFAGLGDGSVMLKLSLGDIRSIKVNIIGEASMPGTYTLPSFATLFNALYEAGGVSDIGSLRNIKLIRGGRQVAELDVYDYLINGKQEVNIGLHDNDMIVVQPYENFVKVTGKIKRPRIYEMKRNETAQSLLDFAGGFTGDAYKDNITVARKTGRMKSLHTVREEDFGSFTMADGDSVKVGEIIRQYANRVSIEGAVWRPGDYELGNGLTTLRQLIDKAEGIRQDALMSRTIITRLKEDFTFEVLAIDLRELLNGTMPDIELRAEDLVNIPSINAIREGYTVEVKGEINTPRTLLYRESMTIEDAILMANGLKESASLARIEVSRRIKNPNSISPSERIAELYSFNVQANLGLSPETAVFKLEPFDEVFIRRSPGYSEQRNVFAEGEFLFVGEYSLATNNDRLADLVDKAGGFTPEAYLPGAHLKRKMTEDRLSRQETLNDLSERSSMGRGDTIVMKRMEVGDYYHIAIDLPSALKDPNGLENLVLEEGDRLIIPKLNNTVTISGAVLYPTTVTYVKGMKLKDYITRGGGYATRAKKKPFIIYANGLPNAKKNAKVEPGSEIVVPHKPPKAGMSTAEIMSLSTSAISMAAMITSIFK